MTWFFMPEGFGALLLRPDALPDANPRLFRAWVRLSGVLDIRLSIDINIYINQNSTLTLVQWFPSRLRCLGLGKIILTVSLSCSQSRWLRSVVQISSLWSQGFGFAFWQNLIVFFFIIDKSSMSLCSDVDVSLDSWYHKSPKNQILPKTVERGG